MRVTELQLNSLLHVILFTIGHNDFVCNLFFLDVFFFVLLVTDESAKRPSIKYCCYAKKTGRNYQLFLFYFMDWHAEFVYQTLKIRLFSKNKCENINGKVTAEFGCNKLLFQRILYIRGHWYNTKTWYINFTAKIWWKLCQHHRHMIRLVNLY